jgi:hypothetical protein
MGTDVVPAPRWRRLLAGAIDAAPLIGVAWALRRPGRLGVFAPRGLRLLGSAAELARTHLRSPGQRLLGLRTVHTRSGGRPSVRRSLALLAVRTAGELLVRRATRNAGAVLEGQQQRLRLEMEEIERRHAGNPDAKEAAVRELFEGSRLGALDTRGMLRAIAPGFAMGQLNHRLRRRLLPTTEVLARRGRPTTRTSAR